MFDLEARAWGAAAWLALPFAALLTVLAVVVPPSASQSTAADPLVQLLGRHAAGLTVAATVAVAIGWGRTARVGRGELIRAIAGIAAAVAIAGSLRLVVGTHLPSFVPPEESSAPGVTLGLSAGLLEEVVFRLVVLPGVYLAGRRALSARSAAALAIVVTAALFSLSHELGPAGGELLPRFLATRFVMPGIAMSLVAFAVGPTFVVSAHCVAHLLIAVWFHR